MPYKTRTLATAVTALLIAWWPLPATADLAAGVAAYQRRDFVGALREFQEEAKRDNVRAMIYLGIMYADGVGTPHDDRQAAAMFSMAALLGSPEAMANLGRMHAEGRGVPQDNAAAIAAYRAAARSGFQPAIVRMAEIHEKGDLGQTPDPAMARDWRAQLTGQPPRAAPAAAVPAVTVAVAPPAEPVETPDMATLARAARTQLQNPQAQPAAAASPVLADPVPEAISAETVIPPPEQTNLQTQPAAAVPPVAASAVPEVIPPLAVTPPPRQRPVPQPLTAAPQQVPAPAPNLIESIAVTVQSSEIQIRVRTKTRLTARPVDFVVATPPRIVFDFPHTTTGLSRHHEVGEGDLRSVDVIPGDSRTRMVLILRNAMTHDLKMDRDELLITLTPVKRGGN